MGWINKNISLLLVSLFAIFFLVIAIMQGRKITEMRYREDVNVNQQTKYVPPPPVVEQPPTSYPSPNQEHQNSNNNGGRIILATVKTELGSNLNIRDLPNKTGEVLGSIPFGTEVKVLQRSDYDNIDGHSNYWYLIEANGIRGYAWGRYLE
jgi:hypothetical protein